MRRKPTEQEIAARAQLLWEQSEDRTGDPHEKWLQAKAELEAAEVAAESDDVAPASPEGEPGPRTKRPRGE